MPNITLNGASQECPHHDLWALLQQEKIAEAKGIAVAINGVIISKQQWATTTLAAGDKVEIVKPFGGG
ncbi:MAG: sulfur carrier protein ThiS [Alphaproteobacteria bacterium]